MDVIEGFIERIRALPRNSVFVFLTYAGVVFALTSSTPTEPPVSDFAYYVDMANGLPAPDPFGKRILVPILAGLLGGSPMAFHYMNIILVSLAAFLLYLSEKGRERGVVAGLLFLGATRAVTLYSGEPSPDGMTYFLVALSLFLVRTNRKWLFVVVPPLAAATHPATFVITSLVWVFDSHENISELLLLLPGALVFLALFPQSYGSLYIPGFVRFLWMVESIGVLWLGFLSLKKNRRSLLVLFVLAACFGFSLVASNVDRMFSFMGLFLAPMLASIIFPVHVDKESDSGTTND